MSNNPSYCECTWDVFWEQLLDEVVQHGEHGYDRREASNSIVHEESTGQLQN